MEDKHDRTGKEKIKKNWLVRYSNRNNFVVYYQCAKIFLVKMKNKYFNYKIDFSKLSNKLRILFILSILLILIIGLIRPDFFHVLTNQYRNLFYIYLIGTQILILILHFLKH